MVDGIKKFKDSLIVLAYPSSYRLRVEPQNQQYSLRRGKRGCLLISYMSPALGRRAFNSIRNAPNPDPERKKFRIHDSFTFGGLAATAVECDILNLDGSLYMKNLELLVSGTRTDVHLSIFASTIDDLNELEDIVQHSELMPRS